jgi:aspartate ammonia-lyase
MPKLRTERDSLGEREVPAGAYYGIQTLRAIENYPISGLRPDRRFIDAYAYQKKASVLANMECGVLDRKKGEAIARACDEILAGHLRDQFVVDVFHSGAGVSMHMNVNEVLANRAAEILGGKRGEYKLVHPNDHVNFGQSTNDTFPTAMRLSALLVLRELEPALAALEAALDAKGKEFDGILKSGRTHLQDAVPIRLGQEFAAYARAIGRSRAILQDAAGQARELGLGGTAAGTGLNTPPGYREAAIRHLREMTGLDLRPAPDMREAMQSNLPMAALAAALKMTALEILRITNDLRLLSAGPLTGLAEIRMPAVQPGSSIMPGKVNPAIAEVVAMVCFHVIGAETAVALAVQAGQLELNVMMPVMAFEVCFSGEILKNAVEVLRTRCVDGITADEERCRQYAEISPSIITALTPQIGYAQGAEVVKQALREGKTIPQVVRERGLLSEEDLKRSLDPRAMTEPGIVGER